MRTADCLLTALLLSAAAMACRDPLTVENTNNPDRERLLANPTDLEALIGGSYRSLHAATIAGSLVAQARVLAFEVAANAGDYGQGIRLGIPRVPIDNSRGNSLGTFNYADFNETQRAARTAADGLNRLLVGHVSAGSAAQDARNTAFGWFVLGAAMGSTALMYDSAAIVDPRADLSEVPGLSGYSEVMAAALRALDSAIAWASISPTPVGTNGFPIPSTWINGVSNLDGGAGGDFVRLVRTWKALLRASVARTPAEATSVNWAAVRDDAAAGITADVNVTTATSPTWGIGFQTPTGGENFHQAYQFIIGMADSSGAYDAWLATPVALKAPFVVQTADRRFPSGADRATQLANSPALPPAGRYFRIRISAIPADAWSTSYYQWYRRITWTTVQNWLGPWRVLTKAQNDLLRAEALVRLGDIAAAAAIVDVWRTAAGLPALAGVVTALGQPVPGGRACVPRIPQPPSFTTAACGDLWEALKWEFRMETQFAGYSPWFLAGRRWGDLPEGTAVHWPVPYQEMDARGRPFYDLGGVGGRDAVGKGTYGL